MSKYNKPLELSNKHLTKEEIAKKELAENLVKAKSDKLKAPSWLKDKIAKKEFNRVLDELKELEFINNLDTNNLACYCEAYSNYIKATKELNNSTLTVEKVMQNGAINIVENPLINIQKKYAEEMRKFASLCGLTIDSRLKIGMAKVEKINDGIEDEFGDI